jgi:LemA protein
MHETVFCVLSGGISMVYITVFGILMILVFWIISVQRTFVVLDENISNSMTQIGVQLSSKWDVLISLLDLTLNYDQPAPQILIEKIKARNPITRDSSPDDIRIQEDIMAEVRAKIMTIAESFPDIKTNETFTKNMKAVDQYEKMVRTSKLIYNESATKLNHAIHMFPATLITGMLGFKKCAYIKIEDI